MRKIVTSVLAAVLVLTCGGSALAVGRFGATDLMNVPTSGTLNEGVFAIYGNFNEGGTTVFGFDYGLITDFEVGVAGAVWTGGQSVGLRVKYHLLTERQDGFGLAAGLQNIGEGYLTPYVVAGKTLTPGLEGYLGIGGGGIDGIFLGLNKRLNLGRGADLFVEYDSYDINLGCRFRVLDNMKIDVGLDGLNEVVVGLTYLGRF